MVGISGIGDASLSIGGRFEYAILRFRDLGNGVLSLPAPSLTDSYSALASSTTSQRWPLRLPLQAGQPASWDRSLAWALGDCIQTVPSSCPGCSFNSGLYLIGRVGIRCFVILSLALCRDAGTSAGALFARGRDVPKLKDGK